MNLMPGRAKVSSVKGTLPGRWIVFDKNITNTPTTDDVISDHETFEDAVKACRAMRTPKGHG